MNCPNNKSRNCCNSCTSCGTYVTIQGPPDPMRPEGPRGEQGTRGGRAFRDRKVTLERPLQDPVTKLWFLCKIYAFLSNGAARTSIWVQWSEVYVSYEAPST